MVPKIFRNLALVGITALALTGCAVSTTTAQTTTAQNCESPASSNSEVLEAISVTGGTDGAPDVEMFTPLHTQSTQSAIVEPGTGTQITTGNQVVAFDFLIFGGESGKQLLGTPYDVAAEPTSLAQWASVFPTLPESLQCASAGSRVVVALDSDTFAEGVADQIGLSAGESAVMVVDVRKVYLDKANGAPVFNAGFNLPTVVRAPDGRPGVTIPDVDPPADLVSQVLKKGDGATVSADDRARLHYTGLLWSDSTVFDSSWEKGEPAGFVMGEMIPGFREAVVGQTVGSQIMVVIPPDQAYGDEAAGAIPAGSTLVFVIDILGIDEPAA